MRLATLMLCSKLKWYLDELFVIPILCPHQKNEFILSFSFETDHTSDCEHNELINKHPLDAIKVIHGLQSSSNATNK